MQRKWIAEGTCALMAAGLLAGGAALPAQAAVGDAAYTQAVNKAIIMGNVYNSEQLPESSFPICLASELTGKKLQTMTETYYDEDVASSASQVFTYVYDETGVHNETQDLYSYESFTAEGPSISLIAYDAAGYPTALVAQEVAYETGGHWNTQYYQNTYDEAGRLSTVTQFTVRSTSDPQPLETSTPSAVYVITYDEAGRIATIAEQYTDMYWVGSEDDNVYDFIIGDIYNEAFAFTYDAQNQLTAVDFGYVSQNGASGSSHNEYTYNSLGEVLTHSRVDSSDPTAAASSSLYTYDENGTLTGWNDLLDARNYDAYVFQ